MFPSQTDLSSTASIDRSLGLGLNLAFCLCRGFTRILLVVPVPHRMRLGPTLELLSKLLVELMGVVPSTYIWRRRLEMRT